MTHVMQRRQALKRILAATGVASTAGCLDGIQGGNENDWPPEGNLVEFITQGGPGSTGHLGGSIWGSYLVKHLDGIDRSTVTTVSGALGLTANNRVWHMEPNGGTLLIQDLIPLTLLELTSDVAEYEATEFTTLSFYMEGMRGIQLSQHSPAIDIEDHWQWDWDTFIDHIDDITIGASTSTQFLMANYIEKFDSRLSRGDIDIVPFDSGSAARARVLDGDVDGYFGAFGTNYFRDDFYKTQFVLMDERRSSAVESIYATDSNATLMNDTSLSPDQFQPIVDATMNARMFLGPPGMDDDTRERLESGIKAAAEDTALQREVEETFGSVDLNHSSVVGDDARQAVEDKYRTLQENMDLLPEEF